jgi:hypothetical protein
MRLNYNELSQPEYVLNKWLEKECDEMDLIVVNDIPILVEDCLSILNGLIVNVKNSADKLIVTTKDNMSYVIESFKEVSITN